LLAEVEKAAIGIAIKNDVKADDFVGLANY